MTRAAHRIPGILVLGASLSLPCASCWAPVGPNTPNTYVAARASAAPRASAVPAPPVARVTVTNSKASSGTLAYGLETGDPDHVPATIVLQSPGAPPQRIFLPSEPPGYVPFDPVLSPDGRRIAFTDGPVLDSTQAQLSTLDRGAAPPVRTDVRMLDTRFRWSPDSLHIAFVYGGNYVREETMRLGIYDVQARKIRWIARNPGVDFMCWTSHNTLLYATEPDGRAAAPAGPGGPPARRARIYEIGADGGIPRLVIPDVGTGVDAPGSGYGPVPVPSPDGHWIAIRDCPPELDGKEWDPWAERTHQLPAVSTMGVTGDDVSKWGDGIYLFDRTTGKKRLLIPLPFKEAPLVFWTPDSRTLLRLDQNYNETASGPGDTAAALTVVDAITGREQRVATLRAHDDGGAEARGLRDGSVGAPWQFEPAGVSGDGRSAYLWKTERYLADPALLPDYHAFSTRTTLLAVDLATGVASTLCTSNGMEGAVSWLPGYVLRPSKTTKGK